VKVPRNSQEGTSKPPGTQPPTAQRPGTTSNGGISMPDGAPKLPGSQPPPSASGTSGIPGLGGNGTSGIPGGGSTWPLPPSTQSIAGPVPPSKNGNEYYQSQYLTMNSIAVHSPLHTGDEWSGPTPGGGSTGCSTTFSVRSRDSADGWRSGEGSENEVNNSKSSGELSTPYLQHGDVRYCKCGGAVEHSHSSVPNLISRPGHGVLDVISYSKMVIFLHQNGNMSWEQDGKRTKVRCNIKASRLDKHGGYLYALASGLLYRLDNATLNSKHRWQWILCSWSPAGLIHTSSTLDGIYLWLQDSNNGYLYNQEYELIETVEMGQLRRRYGNTISEYVTYHPSVCDATVSISGTTTEYKGICNALLTREGQLIAIGRNDLENYSDVKLVNWMPYFISQNR